VRLTITNGVGAVKCLTTGLPHERRNAMFACDSRNLRKYRYFTVSLGLEREGEKYCLLRGKSCVCEVEIANCTHTFDKLKCKYSLLQRYKLPITKRTQVPCL
jgi:hypothetical protein